MVRAELVVNAAVLELFEALVQKISRLGEIVVNGRESNGNILASSFLMEILNCRWIADNVLPFVIFFKSFLPSASKSFDKRFFEKLLKDVDSFELPKEVALQSTIAYHLVVILERSGNPLYFSLFFRFVKEKMERAADVYDSILMAVNTRCV